MRPIRCSHIWRKAPLWESRMRRSSPNVSPACRTIPPWRCRPMPRSGGRAPQKCSAWRRATADAITSASSARRSAMRRCAQWAARGYCITTIGFMIGVRLRLSRSVRSQRLRSAMPTTYKALFPTTVAGSLPKPAWLAEPNKLWAPWRLKGDELDAGKDDATLLAIKLQEDAGIDIVGDGEQARQHFVHGFLEAIDGIDFDKRVEMGIRNDRYKAMCPTVVGPLRLRARVHAREAQLARAHTRKKLKFTLPGPMTIVDTTADAHYGDRVKMAMAFAALLNEEVRGLAADGVDVIEFDEPVFNVYMEAAARWGIEALHRAIEGLTCKTAVHICYGYGIPANIQWKATLGAEWRQYEQFFPALAKSRIDQVSLECINSHVRMSVLKLLDGKDVLIGAIDVANDAIETPEEVAGVIAAAAEFVQPHRIIPCTNGGMAPMRRDSAAAKLQALARGAALARRNFG